MGNRVKTDANDAMKKLSNYLQRDKTSSNQLKAIAIYMAELRRERTKLLDENAKLKERLESATAAYSEHEQEAKKLRAEVEREQNKRRTAECASKLAQKETTQTKQFYELGLEGVETARPFTQKHVPKLFHTLVRELPRFMPSPPLSYGTVAKEGDVSLFFLDEILTTCSRHEFTVVGMLAAVNALLGKDMVYRLPSVMCDKKHLHAEDRERFFKWMVKGCYRDKNWRRGHLPRSTHPVMSLSTRGK